ncbi:hypothetical protein LH47_00918 [Anoxybacillus thermarum]|uniref:Uncharacterized protein n=1 Tax=Anoxybacillus thermarum TaxID=404937 RepID=A0A0D0QAF3_9BACL|nr:hypothetical protein [Anoxybacillus thermarum]KIQ94953.1 hypothetical protein LH47_00918 [Anoxybacillus thermarum]
MKKAAIAFVVGIFLFFTLETFHIVQWYRADVWSAVVFSFGLIVHIYVFKRRAREHEAFLLLPAAIALWMGVFSLFLLHGGTMYVLAFTIGLLEWWALSKEEWLKQPTLFCFGCSVMVSLEAGEMFLVLFVLMIGIGAYAYHTKRERANVY